MPEKQFAKILMDTIRIAETDSIIVYRNLLVKRECPASLSDKISGDRELSKNLLDRDLSFIYNNYVVETISRGQQKWDTELAGFQTAGN